MAKNVIIGSGLIATALKKKINTYGWYPTDDTEVIYYLSGSTHPDFEKNPSYFFSKEQDDIHRLYFQNKKKPVKIIYASSALVYEGGTRFTDMKELCERRVLESDGVVARIFPVYGKGEKKTVISKWIDDIKNNRRPEIYGDGTQSRDFIHVDDVVEQLLFLSTQPSGLYDIGTGTLTSFNIILFLINQMLGKNIQPEYIAYPEKYKIEGVVCKKPLLITKSIQDGIKTLLES